MPVAPHSAVGLFADMRATQLAFMDQMRGAQARTLDLFGFSPHECPYEVIASGPHWRLRRYEGTAKGAPLLLVPAPIKRPYIWDLTPSVSAVRFCLDRKLAVYLLEWLPPSEDGRTGIEAYAGAIVEAADIIAGKRGGARPFVIGHSLGGTLAAIACALDPSLASGLVLLGSPLSFEAGSSPFRDLVVAQPAPAADGTVPGSQLSQACALLSPGTFVWSRWMDGLACLADRAAFDLHVHVVRWALDEVPLPGRLVHEIVEWLYREDRFHRSRLVLGGRSLGPETLHVPVLAIVGDGDEIGPRASVEPFFARMAASGTEIIEHPAEVGVGLQHLAILAGRRAHAQTWPAIAGWIDSHARQEPSHEKPLHKEPRRAAS